MVEWYSVPESGPYEWRPLTDVDINWQNHMVAMFLLAIARGEHNAWWDLRSE